MEYEIVVTVLYMEEKLLKYSINKVENNMCYVSTAITSD